VAPGTKLKIQDIQDNTASQKWGTVGNPFSVLRSTAGKGAPETNHRKQHRCSGA